MVSRTPGMVMPPSWCFKAGQRGNTPGAIDGSFGPRVSPAAWASFWGTVASALPAHLMHYIRVAAHHQAPPKNCWDAAPVTHPDPEGPSLTAMFSSSGGRNYRRAIRSCPLGGLLQPQVPPRSSRILRLRRVMTPVRMPATTHSCLPPPSIRRR